MMVITVREEHNFITEKLSRDLHMNSNGQLLRLSTENTSQCLENCNLVVNMEENSEMEDIQPLLINLKC